MFFVLVKPQVDRSAPFINSFPLVYKVILVSPFSDVELVKVDASVEFILVGFKIGVIVLSPPFIGVARTEESHSKVGIVVFLYLIDSFVEVEFPASESSPAPHIIADVDGFI